MNKPRLFVDSDVILDLVLQREDHFGFAQNLFVQYQQGKCALFTSSIVLANMHFIIRKLHDIKFANSSVFFEDGVQYFSALRSKKVDVLVTRNVKDYKHALLPVFTPKQWCKR